MEQIKETIKEVIQSWQGKKSSPEAGLEACLKKTLTKKEFGHIKLNYFRKGILGIKVDSSAWMYVLSLRKEGLLSKLRAASSAVKEIRFSLGETK